MPSVEGPTPMGYTPDPAGHQPAVSSAPIDGKWWVHCTVTGCRARLVSPDEAYAWVLARQHNEQTARAV